MTNFFIQPAAEPYQNDQKGVFLSKVITLKKIESINSVTFDFLTPVTENTVFSYKYQNEEAKLKVSAIIKSFPYKKTFSLKDMSNEQKLAFWNSLYFESDQVNSIVAKIHINNKSSIHSFVVGNPLKQTKNQLKTLEWLKGQYNTQIDKLKAKKKTAENDYENEWEAHYKLKKEFESFKTKSQKTLQSANTQYKSLENKFNTLSNTLEELQTEYTSFKTSAAKLKTTLETSIKNLRDELSDVKKDLQDFYRLPYGVAGDYTNPDRPYSVNGRKAMSKFCREFLKVIKSHTK